MAACFNFHLRFRVKAEKKFLSFRTTDGISWKMGLEREVSEEVGFIMKLIFYKVNSQDTCHYLNMEITSARNWATGVIQKNELINKLRTEIRIDFMEILEEFNFRDSDLNIRENKVEELYHEKLRFKISIHEVPGVPVTPVVPESTKLEDLRHQMYYLMSSAMLSNITVRDEDRRSPHAMKLHVCILLSEDGNFYKVLRACFRDDEVQLPRLGMEIFLKMLSFIYAKIFVPMDILEANEIRSQAKLEKDLYLESSGMTLMKRNITKRTVCHTLLIARENNLQKLIKECVDFIYANEAKVAEYDKDWKAVDKLFEEAVN